MVGMNALTDRIVTHRRVTIVLLLAVVLAMGAGAAQVQQESSLSQFETSSTEAQTLSYIQSNFTAAENTTTVQVIVRDDNVLSQSSLLDLLRFQRAIAENETVNETLSTQQRPVSIATVVATASIRQRQGQQLQQRAAQLQAARAALNRTGRQLSDALNRTRGLQQGYAELNRSYAADEIDRETYRQRARAIERNLTAVRQSATANLSTESAATFGELFSRTRSLQSNLSALNASYAAGEIDRETYRQRATEIRQAFREVYAGIERVLAPRAQELQQRAAALQDDRAVLQQRIENGSTPPIDEQIDAIESMNASQVDAAIRAVLSEDSDAGAFALMPTGYEPGSTSAEATMVVITQITQGQTGQGAASEEITTSQLAIQDISRAELDGEALVFGAGIVADEINRSMQDSLAVVGPFAILFVLLVLTIAYRDLLDIVLGVVGIFLVLLVTFGYMGWAGVAFNQIFVAIPVLLIGLSIDYAIHVFMRHREQRGENGGIAGAMRTALAGVMTALVLVTATTVIGFMSNVISPVGPIQQFGVVSSVGIVAALVVFGALVPALKVELDGFLENRGFDRKKRAFGTDGGAFGRFLSVGETLARKAPYVVIVLVLVVSAAGAYGATNVDTSFENRDFLAEDPPGWMEQLPGSMQPGEYTMRETFTYVNENFIREDTTGEFLYEGDVATAEALERVAETRDRVGETDVAIVLPNGEPDIRSPLTVMRSVAATNETFNATFQAADTDGDGVPDRNVEGVYDSLFATAPDQAQQFVYREGGEYRALRLTVSLQGGAAGDEIRSQLEAVESEVSGGGVTVTATGQPIVNEIVQNDLLQTVIESLIITLAVSFVFLMVVYRLTEGSATLGLVTLMPVAFNVAWILGTMYLMNIPFNVLTGMITSLTIGLGVAYGIHISERYSLELDRHDSAWTAMETAVTGTGGALLGSAATTVGGFGVLVFAILPPLQQFGFITALTIVYAFLASVFVLPSLLVVWTRYFGPADALDVDPDEDGRIEAEPAGGDED